MNITRRKFIAKLAIAGGFAAVPYDYVTASTRKGDWKQACKAWMKVLVPADEFGPGAYSFAVWMGFVRRLENDKNLAQMIISDLQRYSGIRIPETEVELQRLLKTNEEVAGFLKKLQSVVFESYYGTATGWSELGFDAPPQPKGFKVI